MTPNKVKIRDGPQDGSRKRNTVGAASIRSRENSDKVHPEEPGIDMNAIND